MPHVVSIAYTPAGPGRRPADHFHRVAVDRAELVAGRGIAGDAKARRGGRQLNVLPADAAGDLRAAGFRAGPGELGEQLVVAGLPAGAAVVGARQRVGGSAVVELASVRVPCGRFARVQGRPKDAAVGRLGFMARVLTGDVVAVGAPVVVEAADPTAAPGRGGCG